MYLGTTQKSVRDRSHLPIAFSLIVLQATIIKTMALSSKLTEADCQFLALLVLHTVAVHGNT